MIEILFTQNAIKFINSRTSRAINKFLCVNFSPTIYGDLQVLRGKLEGEISCRHTSLLGVAYYRQLNFYHKWSPNQIVLEEYFQNYTMQRSRNINL